MKSNPSVVAARWAPPVIVPAATIAALLAGPETFAFWVSGRSSVFENVCAFVLIAALAMGIHAAARPEAARTPGLRAWLIVWCLAVLYFVGEDMNWGQHIFGWASPEFFMAYNKEAETNLHNISPWFNQKPRVLVQAWVLLCFLVPLGWSWPKTLTGKFVPAVLWPGRETMGLALATSVIPLFEYPAKAVWGDALAIRFSEIQEFFFAWFMLLYAMDVGARMARPVAERARERDAVRVRLG